VLDAASRSFSGLSGVAERTPMVTADSVATTAIGADTRTERGIPEDVRAENGVKIRVDRGVRAAGVSRLWRC
jgi:hypothetical protein